MLTHPAAVLHQSTSPRWSPGPRDVFPTTTTGAATMSISFPKTEEEVLKLWRDVDAFQTQLRLTEDGPRFTFYDGPPFGTCWPPRVA